MRIVVDVSGLRETRAGLRALLSALGQDKRGGGLKPFWRNVVDHFYREEKEVFDKEGAHKGAAPWASLSEDYAEWKRRVAPGAKILQLRAHLRGEAEAIAKRERKRRELAERAKERRESQVRPAVKRGRALLARKRRGRRKPTFRYTLSLLRSLTDKALGYYEVADLGVFIYSPAVGHGSERGQNLAKLHQEGITQLGRPPMPAREPFRITEEWIDDWRQMFTEHVESRVDKAVKAAATGPTPRGPRGVSSRTVGRRLLMGILKGLGR